MIDKKTAREFFTDKFLRDRNLKVNEFNIEQMKGTCMEAELRIIFRKNNCL